MPRVNLYDRLTATLSPSSSTMTQFFFFFSSSRPSQYIHSIQGWDFQMQHGKSIPPEEGKVQVNHGYLSPVLKHLDTKLRAIKSKKDRTPPFALTLFEPVLQPPRYDTKV